MSNSARSIFIFGLYLLLLGITLLLAPNILLRMFSFSPTNEIWIRIVGMLVLFLSFYYTQAARRELNEFFRWTLYVRFSVIVFFIAFVLLGLAEPTLILFGVVDVIGAFWTFLALRSEKAAEFIASKSL
jgi:hypothetical protein